MSDSGAGAGAGAGGEGEGSSVETQTFIVSLSGTKTELQLPLTSTIEDLKALIGDRLEIDVGKAKVIGIPKKAADSDTVAVAFKGKLSKPSKIQIMGSGIKRVMTEADKALRDAIEDDLADVAEDTVVAAAHRTEYLELIEKRIRTFKPKMLAGFDPAKTKVLVLDIDYTLFDHRSTVERPHELMRPHLHDFLKAVSPYYNIVIWSATSMKWIEVKMREMGVTEGRDWSIAMFMDYFAMIEVEAEEETKKVGRMKVKPLGVLWGQFPEFARPENTIMFDDVRRNFIMNKQNGLRIRACRNLPETWRTDTELLRLTEYLLLIKDLPSFSDLNHRKWERYVEKHTPRK